MMTQQTQADAKIIIFFDGVCNLCNGFIDFVVRHDRKKAFKIASLQGSNAKRLLPSEQITALESVVLFENGHLSFKSTAALKVMGHLPAPWSWVGVFLVIPSPLRDFVYDWVAQNRYRLFGKKDTCRLPTAEEKAYFLD